MSHITHDAILVSGEYEEDGVHWAERARAAAKQIMGGTANVSGTVDGVINSVRTFMVAPDGSKEGWEESDAADASRARFIEWLEMQRYDDGSHPLRWCAVRYGDREG